MAKQILIHWRDLATDTVDWVAVDDRGLLASDIHYGTLAEAAHAVEGQRCALVVSGDSVLLTRAQVPGGSAARAQQAVPFVLEEQLADDVDDLHFALGARGSDDHYPVAVIGNSTMDQITTACSEAGLRPTAVVAEPLALPLPDADEAVVVGSWAGYLEQQRLVLRLGPDEGAVIDADMAPLVLQQALAGQPPDAKAGLVLYHPPGQTGPGEIAQVPVQQRDCPHLLTLFAAGLAKGYTVNLLQGRYNPRTGFDKAWKPWRPTAALLVALLVVFFGSRWLDVRQLESEAAELDTAREQVFAQALPGVRPVRIDQQMRTALAEIGSAAGSGGFTARLNQIAGALATQPKTTLNSLSFRNGRFELDLTTDELPTLDALGSLIAERGELSMTVQSASNERDGLRSRVRVE